MVARGKTAARDRLSEARDRAIAFRGSSVEPGDAWVVDRGTSMGGFRGRGDCRGDTPSNRAGESGCMSAIFRGVAFHFQWGRLITRTGRVADI
jgi:hypothetical protein